MAKSLRASRKKANKSQLRARVHKPVEDARNERLSAKLLEIASKPKDEIKILDTETPEDGAQDADETGTSEEANATAIEKMDVDESMTGKSGSKSRSNKVQKKRREKVVFSVGKKHGSRPSRKGYKGPGIR